MALKLLRTIDPASLDTDPLTTQPAADAFGPELARTRAGLPRVIVWEVDTAGRKVSPPTTTSIDVAIVMLSRVDVPGQGRGQDFWSRGAINTGVLPGEEQVQREARPSVGYTAIITAEAGTANLLAVYAEDSP